MDILHMLGSSDNEITTVSNLIVFFDKEHSKKKNRYH